MPDSCDHGICSVYTALGNRCTRMCVYIAEDLESLRLANVPEFRIAGASEMDATDQTTWVKVIEIDRFGYGSLVSQSGS